MPKSSLTAPMGPREEVALDNAASRRDMHLVAFYSHLDKDVGFRRAWHGKPLADALGSFLAKRGVTLQYI